MTTSRLVAHHVLLLNPVPASRPRVTRWGTYYAKTYKNWMAEAARLLKSFDFEPASGCLRVELGFLVQKPKTTKRDTPRGDIDNYCKAALDAYTKAGLWGDDDQIVTLHASKQFAEDGDVPCIIISVWQQ